MGYGGSIELISGIKQKNNGNFPLVDASAVRVTDDERLDDMYKKIELMESYIPDTVQTITFDQQTGNISQILHSRNNVAVRTDVFTFGSNSVTEVRTLDTGESLTIDTNTATLVTTVAYTTV